MLVGMFVENHSAIATAMIKSSWAPMVRVARIGASTSSVNNG
jgi:hypothetical protein